MKAEDLRIGNLVQIRDKQRKVSSLSIGKCPIATLVDGCSFSEAHFSESEAEPIPLDEAWLIKMQFHRWGESNTFGNGKVIIHKRKRGWVINTKTPVMESVNQFMNYHYAVTGTELTVSE